MPRTLCFAALLSAPVGADTPAGLPVELPAAAQSSGEVSDPPGRYGVATGVWDGQTVPFVEINGTRVRHGFRLLNAPGALADTVRALSEGLRGAGYEIILSCTDLACGGFDFRHRLDVLPLPEMYVDLGDFRYISGKRGMSDTQDESLVSLLASASGDLVYLQIDLVTPLTDAQSGTDADKVLPAVPQIPAVETAQTGTASTGTASTGTAPTGTEQAGTEQTETSSSETTDTASSSPLDPETEFQRSGEMVLEDVRFASGSSELIGTDHASLIALALFVDDQPGLRIALVGHTDTTGTLDANVAVSRRRAQAVADRLVSAHGVERSRLLVEGVGFLAPRADNETEAGRALNRRVTAVLVPPS